MQAPWLEQYPSGIPATVDVGAFASLPDLMADSCRRFAELPAYWSMGRTLTYRELDEQSRAFGAWLQKKAGLDPGERVALMLPNLLQYPIALFGLLRAGLVAVNVNPLYTPRELEHQLVDSGAVAIIVLENFAHTLEEVIGCDGAAHRDHDPGRRLPGAGQAPADEPGRQARQEDGAAVAPAGCPAVPARAGRRAGAAARAGVRSAATIWPSCNTPAAPRAWPRAPC